MIGATFIWAGLSKLVPTIEFAGQDAAILANLGTGIAPSRTTKPPASNGAAPSSPALSPPATLPLPDAPPAGQTPPKGDKPTSSGKNKSPVRQTRTSADSAQDARTPVLAAFSTEDLPAAVGADRKASASKSKSQPTAPTTPATTPPAATNPPKTATTPDVLPPGGKYSAADFPEPARARRAYALSILMVHAAYPQATPAHPSPSGFWPKMLADSPWVIWLSFGAAVAELFAGVLVLVGFLTRLSSLMLVLVMATAMWLTQIGPAMSIGQTQFGILPDKVWWDPVQWSTFFWQLLLIVSSIALACLGGGAMSVDRALAVIGSGGPKTEQEPPAKP
ncbi:MAG: DoxX family membrane protein [Phycisphaerales bacterium]